MPLDFQKLSLDFSRGANLGTDERCLAPGTYLQADNVVWDKRGAMSKRPGVTRRAGPPTEVRRILSTGRELVALGPDRLYAWTEEARTVSGTQSPTWVDRGPISRYTGKQWEIWRDVKSQAGCDSYLDVQAGQIVIAVASNHGAPSDGPANAGDLWYWDVQAKVVDLVGANLCPPQILGGGQYSFNDDQPHVTTSTAAHAVRCFGAGTGTARQLCVAFLQDASAAGDTSLGVLNVWSCEGDNTGSGFTGAKWTANCFRGGLNERTYDVITRPGTSGEYVVAYIARDRLTIVLETRDATHAVLHTSTIAPTTNWLWRLVSLHQDLADGFVYVTAVEDDGASPTNKRLLVYGRMAHTTAASWGPTTLKSLAVTSPETLSLPGSCVVTIGTTPELVTVWAEYEQETMSVAGTTETGTGWHTHVVWCTTTGTDLRTERSRANLLPLSRPFRSAIRYPDDVQVGRFSLVCSTSCSDWLFESQQLCDFVLTDAPNGLDTTTWQWVGQWNCGTGSGPLGDYVPLIGSLQNVAHDGRPTKDGGFWLASTSRETSVPDPAGAGYDHRYMASLVTLYTSRSPWAVTLPRGTSIIGGARLFCYDSEKTFEHGFAYPPVLTNVGSRPDNTHGAATPYDQTMSAIWECYDANGCLMRSGPTREQSVRIDEAPEQAYAFYRTLHCVESPIAVGSLNDFTRISCVPLLADSTGIMRRALPPTEYKMDLYSNSSLGEGAPNFCATLPGNNGFYTQSGTGQPALYTESGEIESVPVEGAEFVVIAGERVWLGGMFHRDRICHSKRFAAGAGGTTFILPEFNEGFGVSIPNGQDCTGIAALDDKVIVFTADAVYAIVGRGPNDDGSDNDFSGMTLLSDKHGCVAPESIVTFRDGVAFLSRDSLLVVGHGLDVQDLGAPMRDYWPATASTTPVYVRDAWVWPERDLAIWAIDDGYGLATRTSYLLVYDYANQAWSRWLSAATDAVRPIFAGCAYVRSGCMHDGVCYTVQPRHTFTTLDLFGDVWSFNDAANAPRYDYADTYGSAWITVQIRTPWLQPVGPLGWFRCRDVRLLLSATSGNRQLTVKLYQDFYLTASQSQVWLQSVLTGMPEPARIDLQLKPIRQKCSALMVELYDSLSTAVGATAYGDLTVQGLAIEWAPKHGTSKADTTRKGEVPPAPPS